MRTALKEVGIEVLGIRDSGTFIGLVTDIATSTIDGTLTAVGNTLLKERRRLNYGTAIKII